MGIATQEVRQRAIEAYRSGKGTQQQIADMFGIGLRTFARWWEQYQDHGQLAPQPRGHNPPALNEKEMRALDRLIRKRPDLTLAQMRDADGGPASHALPGTPMPGDRRLPLKVPVTLPGDTRRETHEHRMRHA